MKIMVNGNSYEIPGEGTNGPSNFIEIWPGKGGKYVGEPIDAKIDTGCDLALVLPIAVLMDLQENIGIGFSSEGAQANENANGMINRDLAVSMDLHIQTSNGGSIIFQGVTVTVTDTGSSILIGTGILQYLDLIFKGGKAVLIEPSDLSKK